MKGAPTTSPAISSGILTLASEIHNYNTRVNLNIHRQIIGIKHGAITFFFAVSTSYSLRILKESTLLPFLQTL